MNLKPYLKAAASGLVASAAYLAGVIPSTGGFGDVSVVQWLGLVVSLGVAFGVTYNVPYHPAETHDV